LPFRGKLMHSNGPLRNEHYKQEEEIMRSRLKLFFSIPAMFLAIFGVIGSAPAEQEPDVIFVATPQYVVNEMLEMAGTNKDDIVYDLGCGDGRFVITAAKKYGAQGVGIDIDPQLVRESQANARNAGVYDRTKFIVEDLFKTDISQATVVSLYLLPELNLRLRPKLFRELKPGTRIVSHDFDMADWKPDGSGEIGSSSYYLWILPSDVSGRWNVKLSNTTGQDHEYALHLIQKFQELDGQAIFKGEEVNISNIKVRGEKVSFFLSRTIQGRKAAMYFKGQVKGGSMAGNVQIEGGPFTGSHAWTADRVR
jgi:SAM-dependent methyltransferase